VQVIALASAFGFVTMRVFARLFVPDIQLESGRAPEKKQPVTLNRTGVTLGPTVMLNVRNIVPMPRKKQFLTVIPTYQPFKSAT
jgi:hypothetical protein